MKSITSSLLSGAFLLFFQLKIGATTIVPFPNLGEMAKGSGMVVLARVQGTYEVQTGTETRLHTSLTVEASVKVNLPEGANFEIQHLSAKGDGWVRVIPDDVFLSEGSSYLLFLSQNAAGLWEPILMSYGIFESVEVAGEKYLVPLPEWADLNILTRPDGLPVEPLGVYHQQELLDILRAFVSTPEKWHGNDALLTTDVGGFLGQLSARTPPSHCTFLNSGGTGFRWLSFPGTLVEVHAPTAGDSDCSPATQANTNVSNAVTDMENSYDGIFLLYGPTYSGFTPDCTDMTAVGNDFLDWVDANLGGQRNIVIQYQDPCNEITDLVSCAGTLAIGGLYGFEPLQSYDGMNWYQGAYGYVIVNNGVCTCLTSTQYKIMMTHEMTHSLGLGHIASGSGTANMNPSCCNNITTLDEQCVDYLYAPLLPVELISFDGNVAGASIELHWQTASEVNNRSFSIEHSADGSHFQTIGEVSGANNSNVEINYTFVDKQPQPGTNYYRLKQTDFDGQFEHSPVIVVGFGRQGSLFEVSSQPAADGNLQLVFDAENAANARIEVYDLKGSLLKISKLEAVSGLNSPEIQLPDIAPGIYLARLVMGQEVRFARFYKN
ncbi:MAG: T9SS type A sorting domain-containing protein [Bacteroidetes bacterium]|nr:T9SS type A sorting domain-containing protein [Bacteroidota bacterium]